MRDGLDIRNRLWRALGHLENRVEAALGTERALEEIEKNAGILYDEAVVNACLRLFRDKGYHLPE